MKKLIYTTAILSITILLSNCSDPEEDAKNHAEEMCDCVKEIGFNEDINIFDFGDPDFARNLERRAEKELPRKFLKIFREMEKEMHELDRKEKKEYVRTFLKSLLDTDCANIILDRLPYEMIGPALDELEKEVDRNEDY